MTNLNKCILIGASILPNVAFSEDLPKIEKICSKAAEGKPLTLDAKKFFTWVISESKLDYSCMEEDGDTFVIITNKVDDILSNGPGDDCNMTTEFSTALAIAEDKFKALKPKVGSVLSKDHPYRLVSNGIGEDISEIGLFNSDNPAVYECFEDKNDKEPKPKGYRYKIRSTYDEFSKLDHKKSEGGKFSYTKDNTNSKKVTNQTKLAAGIEYDADWWAIRSFTAFGTIDYSKVREKGNLSADSGDKDEKSLGLSAKFLSHWWSADHFFNTTVRYVDEDVKDLELHEASLIYLPRWKGGLNDSIAAGGFIWIPELSIKALESQIKDSGSYSGEKLDEIEENYEYSAVGFNGGLRIKLDNPDFSPFELSLSKSYYKLFDHEQSKTDLVKASLTAFIDKDEHYGVDISYSKGEEGVFLDKVDKIDMSLTFRF